MFLHGVQDFSTNFTSDPGAISAEGAAPAAIPTLSEWGMIAMAGMLAGTMYMAARCKGAVSTV